LFLGGRVPGNLGHSRNRLTGLRQRQEPHEFRRTHVPIGFPEFWVEDSSWALLHHDHLGKVVQVLESVEAPGPYTAQVDAEAYREIPTIRAGPKPCHN
jgi:hypothetical protein